jgi:hypothetical protein
MKIRNNDGGMIITDRSKRKGGFWIPKLAFNGQDIEGLIYHCNHCSYTYMFLSAISQRCPICRELIDVSDLQRIEYEHPGEIV